MQNEWPQGRDDRDDRTNEEADPESPRRSADRPSHGEADHHLGSIRSLSDPAAAGDEAPVTGPPPTGSESVDEGEDHRSAVDAVDELLDEVESSLARLDDGTYGRCDSCGAAIEDTRLAESPVVRTCGACVDVGSPTLVAAGGRAVDPIRTTEDSPD